MFLFEVIFIKFIYIYLRFMEKNIYLIYLFSYYNAVRHNVTEAFW